MYNTSKSQFEFLNSASTLEIKNTTIKDIKVWISEQNHKVKVNVERTLFAKLNKWRFSDNFNNLVHESGKFFSIDGVAVETNWGDLEKWEQPIINQPEIGYLGFLAKEIDGVLCLLVQAKIEPGNVNYVQLSPTLQATKSNYTKVHKGKTPQYLEYFTKAKPEQIVLDQLQSEQGSRFFKKRNRNIIVRISDDPELKSNYKWMTIGQIKALMSEDNLVNMDTRTIVACISFGDIKIPAIDLFAGDKENIFGLKFLNSALSFDKAKHTFDEVLNFITNKKCHYFLNVEKVPLKKISNWVIEEDSIRHVENKYFKVIAAQIEITSREVVNWCQPMVEPAQEGICAFVVKEIDGILHFIVQTKLEVGNFDIIELAPTVQCLTGNYKTLGVSRLPFLNYILNANPKQIILDAFQSEEGGRFYKEQNRNMIVVANDEIKEQLPENYIWMTLNQLHSFIKFNNYLNIQARSLISAIPYI